MSRSSVLQPLGGPLAGRLFEFPGHDVVIGSAPDCEVRIDVAGVHPYHARIVISDVSVTLFGIEGVVGINDDKVLGEGRLNHGDFVWLGEPGAEGSLMFQFALGSEASADAMADPEPVVMDELMEELEPHDLAIEAPPELDLVDIEPQPEPDLEPFAPAPLPDPYVAPEPAPASVLPPPRSTSASGAFKPPAPWQTASTPAEPPAEVEYASAWESKPAASAPEPIEEEVHEEVEAPEPAPEPPPPPPPPARPAPPRVPPPARQNTSPNLRSKAKAAPEVDLAALLPPHPTRPARTTSSTGTIVGGLITLVFLGVGISWVVNSTPPVEAPPSVPGSISRPTPPAAAPVKAVAAPSAPEATLPGAAGLLQQATAAANAGDVAKAGQLVDEALKLEPANADAVARKAEIDARFVILARMFSPGATTVAGARPARNADPSAKADLAAQIRCGVTPASVEPGAAYTVRCSIVNTGQQAFRLESVSATEAADGVSTAFAGAAPSQDLAPQGEAMILEKSGTWSARTQWSLDVTAKTAKASFVVNHSWR